MKKRILLLVLPLIPAVALLLAHLVPTAPDTTEQGVGAGSIVDPQDVMAGVSSGANVSSPTDPQTARFTGAVDPLAASSHPGGFKQEGVTNLSGHSLGHIPPGVGRVDEVLLREIGPRDDRGLVRRTHVLETDFHYPLLQTVELLGMNPQTGEEEVVAYQSMVADHVMVQFDVGLLPEDWEGQLAEKGLRVRRKVSEDGLYLMEFPVEEAGETFAVIESLEKGYNWVRFAEPDRVIQTLSHEDPIPNDPDFGDLWGLQNSGQFGGKEGQDINAVEGWLLQEKLQDDRGAPSSPGDASSVVVAIIDTGVDHTHFDLKENMWVNPREERDQRDNSGDGIVDDIHGANIVTGTGDPMDWMGHGTHVAGTIGAVGNNNFGITGVAWDVQLMGVTILYPGGTMSDAIRGIDYAWQNGADILNNSWGVVLYNARLFGEWRSEALADAILRTRNAGAIFVTAAGNAAENVDTFVDFPAAHQSQSDNVVNVAALDRLGNLASFSNFGPNTVHVAAPGHQILSTVPGNGYASFSGTSMAAPHVSGMFALLKQEYPNESYRQLIQRLLQRSDKESHLAEYVRIGRRVNLARALDPAPLIDDPLEVFEFLPGSHVTLKIGVSESGGPASIQWFKDGALLSGATDTSLSLGHATRADGGVYRVEVTNAHGTSATEAVVRELPTHPELGEILGSPNLTWTSSLATPWVGATEDGSAAVRSGAIGDNQTSGLSTTVVGPGTLHFSWKVSSEQGYDLLTFSIGDNLVETRSGDGGWLHRTHTVPPGVHTLVWRYSKDGGNKEGDDAAWLANVVYENDIPLITSQTSSLEVVTGSPVKLAVNAVGSGPLTYFWKKDDRLLTGKNEAELGLASVDLADAGTYTATVSNVHGITTTLPIVLSVVEAANPPEFTRGPRGYVGPEGSPLTLSATWSGTHPFTVTWYKDGEALVGEEERALQFSTVSVEDTGVYHVVVSNEAGTVESFPAHVRIHPASERYTDWLARHGGLESVRDAGGGEIHPFLRFALGISPDATGLKALPRPALVEEPRIEALDHGGSQDGSPAKHAALVFSIPSFIEGATYRLEASDDLVSWEEVNSSLETIDVLADGRRVVQLREIDPMNPDQARRFLRLRVDGTE